MQFLEKDTRPLDQLATHGVVDLERFEPWDYDCPFELGFPKRSLNALTFDTSHVTPCEVVLSGRSESRIVPEMLSAAAASAAALSDLGVFFWGVDFERKDKTQTARSPATVEVRCSDDGAKLCFTYGGSLETGVEPIAEETRGIMLQSGLVEPDIKMSWWSVRARLKKVDDQVSELLRTLVGKLGSGRIFCTSWDASSMGVDEENRIACGFDLYNRVAASGLSADEIKVVFKLQFANLQGLDVVRQLCEGPANHTIPVGTFRHQRKEAILGVFTDRNGHRLSLTLKAAPTEEEWAGYEHALGATFDRLPFA